MREIKYINFENVVGFFFNRQWDPLLHCNRLGNFSSQFVMEDFSFENKFCQHYKYLRKNAEVFVNFDID